MFPVICSMILFLSTTASGQVDPTKDLEILQNVLQPQYSLSQSSKLAQTIQNFDNNNDENEILSMVKSILVNHEPQFNEIEVTPAPEPVYTTKRPLTYEESIHQLFAEQQNNPLGDQSEPFASYTVVTKKPVVSAPYYEANEYTGPALGSKLDAKVGLFQQSHQPAYDPNLQLFSQLLTNQGSSYPPMKVEYDPRPELVVPSGQSAVHVYPEVKRPVKVIYEAPKSESDHEGYTLNEVLQQVNEIRYPPTGPAVPDVKYAPDISPVPVAPLPPPVPVSYDDGTGYNQHNRPSHYGRLPPPDAGNYGDGTVYHNDAPNHHHHHASPLYGGEKIPPPSSGYAKPSLYEEEEHRETTYSVFGGNPVHGDTSSSYSLDHYKPPKSYEYTQAVHQSVPSPITFSGPHIAPIVNHPNLLNPPQVQYGPPHLHFKPKHQIGYTKLPNPKYPPQYFSHEPKNHLQEIALIKETLDLQDQLKQIRPGKPGKLVKTPPLPHISRPFNFNLFKHSPPLFEVVKKHILNHVLSSPDPHQHHIPPRVIHTEGTYDRPYGIPILKFSSFPVVKTVHRHHEHKVVPVPIQLPSSEFSSEIHPNSDELEVPFNFGRPHHSSYNSPYGSSNHQVNQFYRKSDDLSDKSDVNNKDTKEISDSIMSE